MAIDIPEHKPQTFQPAPLDKLHHLAAVYDWNAENNADLPMVRWFSRKNGIQERTWGEGVQSFRLIATQILTKLGPGNGDTIGILATTGQILYWDLFGALVICGYVPFLISSRNSAEAVEYLLDATKSKHLVVSDDKLDASRNACEKLSVGLYRVDDFPAEQSASEVKFPSYESITLDSPVMISHSSGTTAYPKPIVFTHRIVQYWAMQPHSGDYDLCGRVLGAYSLPMFHGMGFEIAFFATFLGAIATFPPPDEPPVVPTAERVLAQEVATKTSILFAVPAFLEAWSESEAAMKRLSQFDVVAFGGAPVDDVIGDKLIKHGVPLANSYGSTETANISKLFAKPRMLLGGEWAYWEIQGCFTAHLVPVEGTDDHFRIMAKQTEKHILAKFNTVLEDGTPAYDMNDIIVRHPKQPNLWKVVGRFDDQIMHSTGEKTNPGPIEAILRRSSYVQNALMFGRSKFHAGVIISPTDKGRELALPDLVEAIWPEVQQANEFAPGHSRIFPEMIIAESLAKPFEYTAKRTLRRAAMINLYEPEIVAVYEAFENVATKEQDAVDHSQTVPYDETLLFVREAVKSSISAEVGDDDDIFRVGGGDSLSASRIRNKITKTQSFASVIPSDFVYNFPTISKMAGVLHGINLMAKEVVSLQKGADPFQPTVDDPNAALVRFREAPEGQVPLIMLHGGAGMIYDLWLMQQPFETGFWAIQITPDTPLTSLEAQTDFYYQKIKEQQPHGPYRLGGYSASSILACRLAKLFEANGDNVIQLAFIDHSPNMFVAPGLLVDNIEAYAEQSIHALVDMFRRDAIPRRLKLAGELEDAFYGKPSSELGKMLADMFPITSRLVLNFIAGLKQNQEQSMADALLSWLTTINADVTLYVAAEGVCFDVPQTEEWKDLGVRQIFPNAKVVQVEGNHFDIVVNTTVVADLQETYLKN